MAVGIPSGFPSKLDVFPQLVDGYHPDVPEDWNHLTNVITRIQQVLGVSPSGEATDVVELIDTFLDDDGFFTGIKLVVTTTEVSLFVHTGTGFTVVYDTPFPTANVSPFIASLAAIDNNGTINMRTVDQAWATAIDAASVTWKSYARNILSLAGNGSITFATLAVHDSVTL